MDNGYGVVLLIFGVLAFAFSILLNLATKKTSVKDAGE